MIETEQTDHTYNIMFHRTADSYLQCWVVVTILANGEKKLSQDEVGWLFTRLVREWITTTKEGQDAYAESAEDFNIGDLSVRDATFTEWFFEKRAHKGCLLGLDIKSIDFAGNIGGELSYDLVMHPFGPEDSSSVHVEYNRLITEDVSEGVSESAASDDTEDSPPSYWLDKSALFDDDEAFGISLGQCEKHIWFSHVLK